MGRTQLLFLLLHSLLLIVSCHDPIKASQLTRRTLLEEQPQQSSEHLQKVLQRYLNNEEQEAHLRDFVARCGDIATLTSAGKSVEGRELWVLEISDRPGQQEAEPNVKYVGNVHGDEPTGRCVLSRVQVAAPFLLFPSGEAAARTLAVYRLVSAHS
jgi:hypothetical protein